MNNNLNDFVIKTNGLKSNSKRGHLCGMTSTISDQFFYPHPSPPSSSKMNNKSIVQKKHVTNLKTPLLLFHVDVINVCSQTKEIKLNNSCVLTFIEVIYKRNNNNT